jgi:hypothetical protein
MWTKWEFFMFFGMLTAFLFMAVGLTITPRNMMGEKEQAISIMETTGMYDVAKLKMDDLVKTNYWEHNNSDGTTFSERSNGFARGEVLYKGPCDVRNAMKLWEESPEHKAVLDMEYESVVFLMEPKSDGGCYGVMLVK